MHILIQVYPVRVSMLNKQKCVHAEPHSCSHACFFRENKEIYQLQNLYIIYAVTIQMCAGPILNQNPINSNHSQLWLTLYILRGWVAYICCVFSKPISNVDDF